MRSNDEERRLHGRLRALTKPLRRLRLAEGAVSLSLGLIVICQTYLLARLVQGLVFDGKGAAELSPYLWGVVAIFLARGGLLLGQERLAQEVALRVKTSLRQRLSQAFLALGPASLDKEQAGELVNTAVEGVERLDDYFTLYLPKRLHLSLIPPAILVAVAFADPLSAVVLLITGPIIPVLMWLIGTWAKERTRQQWRAMSVMSAHFLDVLQGLRTLQLFGREKEQFKTIRAVSDDFRRTTMSVLTVAFLSGFFLELSASISTAIVAVQVGVRLIEGHLHFGAGFFVLLLAPEYYLPFRQFGAAHHAGMEGVAAAERIFEVLDSVDSGSGPGMTNEGAERDGFRVRARNDERGCRGRAAPPPSLRSGTSPLRREGGGFVEGGAERDGFRVRARNDGDPPQIIFQNISLIYPGRNTGALSQVDLQIPAGQTLAIVGPSGAGKSSLFKLLMGFQRPTAGQIFIDGAPLWSMDLKSWRREVALIPQSPHFFKGTLLDNLLLARPLASEEEVEEALRAARALEFVRRLPRGIHTTLSEAGQNLSGGQRQRLAIARAYLKDSPVLLLDEPSSQLDPLTEDGFRRSFEELCQGRTALIIAHRLNTVLAADQIVLLDKGRVIRCGTHSELYEEAPLYRQMVGSVERWRGGSVAGGGL